MHHNCCCNDDIGKLKEILVSWKRTVLGALSNWRGPPALLIAAAPFRSGDYTHLQITFGSTFHANSADRNAAILSADTHAAICHVYSSKCPCILHTLSLATSSGLPGQAWRQMQRFALTMRHVASLCSVEQFKRETSSTGDQPDGMSGCCWNSTCISQIHSGGISLRSHAYS